MSYETEGGVSFASTATEDGLMLKIASRVHSKPVGRLYERQALMMDLAATNANGTPLDFEKLLGFDDFDFAHDIWGIRANLNRDTGKLEGQFSPRSAR